MGNGQCCKKVDRVETFQYDDETSNCEQSKKESLKQSEQFPQMISLSDSEEEFQKKKQPKLGVFKEPQKSFQMSTGQQYSFQSIPSEQHFQNFVTFQALPSQQGIKGNVFQQFQAEMSQIANQQGQSQKNQKKVQFAL